MDKKIRNYYTGVIAGGKLSDWTGPNPDKDPKALQLALGTAEAIRSNGHVRSAYPVLIREILPEDVKTDLMVQDPDNKLVNAYVKLYIETSSGYNCTSTYEKGCVNSLVQAAEEIMRVVALNGDGLRVLNAVREAYNRVEDFRVQQRLESEEGTEFGSHVASADGDDDEEVFEDLKEMSGAISPTVITSSGASHRLAADFVFAVTQEAPPEDSVMTISTPKKRSEGDHKLLYTPIQRAVEPWEEERAVNNLVFQILLRRFSDKPMQYQLEQIIDIISKIDDVIGGKTKTTSNLRRLLNRRYVHWHYGYEIQSMIKEASDDALTEICAPGVWAQRQEKRDAPEELNEAPPNPRTKQVTREEFIKGFKNPEFPENCAIVETGIPVLSCYRRPFSDDGMGVTQEWTIYVPAGVGLRKFDVTAPTSDAELVIQQLIDENSDI